jgi:hypothetical protein
MLLLLLWNPHVHAQTASASEYQVKAVFIYNFTHFINWPERSFDSQYDSFVIGIIGNDPIGKYVETAIANERVGTHRLRFERFNSIEEIKKCHILYVASKDPDEIKRILEKVDGKNILTVGDTPNFVRWGGMIRFYTEEGRIRLQINNTIAKEEGLKISSKLLRVAQVF